MRTPQRVLAVSPHLDDAVLSAGATLAEYIAAGSEVHVCTLFAGAPQEPLSPIAATFHTSCGLPPDASAVALRIEEDRAAMDELGGARPHHLGYLDAIFRRAADGDWLCRHERAMFDDLGLDHLLRDALAGEVRRLTASLVPDLVLTCAAIGGHIDHLVTRAAVQDATTDVELPILLWEDLPYAVQRGVPFGQRRWPRVASAEPWARKWRAVSRYESQVQMLWEADADWRAELLAHAVDRGGGRPAEMFLDLE